MKFTHIRKSGCHFFQFSAIFTLSAVSFSVNAAGWSIQAAGDLTRASAINNSGQIVGGSRDIAGHERAATYLNGQTVGLGAIYDGPGSQAYGVNNNGEIVGSSTVGYLDTNAAFSTYAPNQVSLLNVDASPSIAYAVNDGGNIVGRSLGFYGSSQAFLYVGGSATNLGTLGSGLYSEARAINNHDQVVGSSEITDDGSYISHAFLYDQGQMHDLGTLGGTDGIAYDVNDQGQIVGSSTLGNGLQHAFLYQNGSMVDLFAGDSFRSAANGINADGDVIGTFGAQNHSFLYRNGAATDLDLLSEVINAGWSDLAVADINDAGEIVGTGLYNGQSRGFVLSAAAIAAIPEPQTYALMLAGLAAVCAAARRRAKTRQR